MADIHIGKTNKTESGKGRARLFYHVPIEAPVSGIVPTPKSAIAAQLQQTEIDALAAGTLVEISRDIVVLASQTQEEIATTLKADWQNVRAGYNDTYSFEHKFYGVTLNATA